MSRFNTSLETQKPLSVPVESLYQDDKGYYVWRGKEQKLCQPDTVIADVFQIEKVYVKPGNLKTYINGPCKEYRVLDDSGSLEEYDYILGDTIPEDLTDNCTVYYKKYKYQLKPDDIVKIEIPDLTKSGFYVPASSVIIKATDEAYVYINDNTKVKRVEVDITGGNLNFFRIEGDSLDEGTEILLLDKNNPINIIDDMQTRCEISGIISCRQQGCMALMLLYWN